MKRYIYRSKAPLRISFAGGGTDIAPYCHEHGGMVVNTTINKYVHVTFDPDPAKDNFRIMSYDLHKDINIPVGNYEFNGSFNYIKAVLKHFQIAVPGTLYIRSDLPIESGMGTSSSLIVALIKVFDEYLELKMSKPEIAQLAYKIEREDLKEAGGYQDQYAATYGGFNFMVFEKEVLVCGIKMPSSYLNELKERLVLCYTGSVRNSGEIQESVAQNNKSFNYNNIMLNLKARAEQIRDLFVKANIDHIDEMGHILNNDWYMKKKLSSKISNIGIDEMYNFSLQHGAMGGKLLGAGGGGFLLLFVSLTERMTLINELKGFCDGIIDFDFEPNGVRSWKI